MSFCPPSEKKKKQVELENQESTTKNANQTNKYRLLKQLGRGVGRKKMAEPVPKSDLKDSDIVTKGSNNNEIVLTTDFGRGGMFSGAGRGRTGAGAIDLVVGRGASDKDGPKANIWKRPNIASDAARIYISQKTDIDTIFNLADGAQGNMTARSGIGIKADAVRVVGTDGIKLVTRTEPQNSKNGTASYNGIELIACNDETDIQSIVKGENLVEALTQLEARLSELSSIVLNHLKDQLQFNMKVASHTHVAPQAPVGAIPTLPSVSLVPAGVQASMDAVSGMLDNYKHRINTNIIWKTKYLNSASSKYICSKYNKVN